MSDQQTYSNEYENGELNLGYDNDRQDDSGSITKQNIELDQNDSQIKLVEEKKDDYSDAYIDQRSQEFVDQDGEESEELVRMKTAMSPRRLANLAMGIDDELRFTPGPDIENSKDGHSYTADLRHFRFDLNNQKKSALLNAGPTS